MSLILFMLLIFGIIERIAFAKTHNNTVLPIMELIENDGYPVEEHFVKTSDDYILRIHRIPHGKNNKHKKRSFKPILLMHGLFGVSAIWVISGPNKGLGYILADAGFDVWMGNNRGTSYSRNHTYLNPNSSSLFWSFSFHEMGMLDMPAMIDYILSQTNQTQLYNIGYSQGNTIFYVMASRLPEYNNKIAAHFSLAPVAYLGHMKSPIVRLMALFAKPLGTVLQLLGFHEFIYHYKIFDFLGEYVCGDGQPTQFVCSFATFFLCGYSPKELNATLFPILFDYTPGDGSTKQLLHFAQLVISKHFNEYNDNFYGNLEDYGRVVPPTYNLSAVTALVYIFYSASDWIASDVDSKKLGEELPNLGELIYVTKDGFNHLDYMLGIHADKYVYYPIVKIIKSLE